MEDYDIVILGAGLAGLACAITAADLGGRVIVLEKMAHPSGNILFAGGAFSAAGTRFQAAAGIKDNTESFFNDLMETSQHRGDPVLTRTYAEKSADAVHWISDVVGVQFAPVVGKLPPVKGRIHQVTGPLRPAGAQLARDLLAAATRRGIPLLFKAKPLELLANSGVEIIGVRAQTKEGPKDFRGKGGVVLATGGFHANKEMVRKYMGEWACQMPLRGTNVCLGENITLCLPFRPKLVNMDQFHGGPVHGPTKANPSIAVNFGICVTGGGERYVDEGSTYVHIGKETAFRIAGNQAFIILDEEARKEPLVLERFARYQRAKAPIYEDHDLSELARKAGIEPQKLVHTVSEYHQALEAKKAKELVPPNSLESPWPIKTPPFYALPFRGGITATFGGPLINNRAQVVNEENKIVPGLYAAGNAAGGLFYEDYIGGSQFGAAVVFARIAAQDALDRVEKI